MDRNDIPQGQGSIDVTGEVEVLLQDHVADKDMLAKEADCENQGAVGEDIIQLRRAPAGLSPVVFCKVGNLPVHAVVDTGATHTIISEMVHQQLKQSTPTLGKVKMKTAGKDLVAGGNIAGRNLVVGDNIAGNEINPSRLGKRKLQLNLNCTRLITVGNTDTS